MNSSEIINYLEDNNLDEVKEIKKKKNLSIIKFYYDFDSDELSAAKSYANEESDFESESDEWYTEYYVPFLKDIAVDNSDSIMEEIMDEYEVVAVCKEIGMENGNYGQFKFIAGFSDDMEDSEIEEILNDYYE